MDKIVKSDFNITMEEFDLAEGNHTFSKRYNKEKKKNLKEYRRSRMNGRRINWIGAVAATLVAMIGTPVIVNAATNGELFERLWGTAGREKIEATEFTVQDPVKGEITYQLPQREYADTPEETAEKLVGENVKPQNITFSLPDGTLMTVLSTTVSDYGAVMEFTLEKAGGIDAFLYNDHTQIGKGMTMSSSAKFIMAMDNAHETIFVDEEKSTDEKWYCYSYMSFVDGKPSELELHTVELSGEFGAGEPEMLPETEKKLVIPLGENEVASTVFMNSQGGTAELSPISLCVDMGEGTGFHNYGDPGEVYLIDIVFNDGTDYIVKEENIDWSDGEFTLKHSCEADTKNYYDCCGGLGDQGTDTVYILDRLVDIDEVKEIHINDDLVYVAGK